MEQQNDTQTPNRTPQPVSADLPSHVSIPTELYCILLKSALSDVNFGNTSHEQTSPINPNATNAVLTSLNKTPNRLDESYHKMNLLVNQYLTEKAAAKENNTLKSNLKESVTAVREKLVEHFNLINSIDPNKLLESTHLVPNHETPNNAFADAGKPYEHPNIQHSTNECLNQLEQHHITEPSPSRWLISPKRIFGSNNVNFELENEVNSQQRLIPDDYNITKILDEIKSKFDHADNTIHNIEAQLESDISDPNKREWEFASFMGPANSDQSVIFEHARALYTNLYNHAKTNKLKISALREKLAVLQAHIKPVVSDHRNAL